MSWWISLEDEGGEAVTVERHAEGGTYAIGGVTEASLNVTYNYGRLFREAGCHPDDLRGRVAGDVLPKLEGAVKYLGMKRDEDYWKATPGNAGYALSVLLEWAKQHPAAVFRVN